MTDEIVKALPRRLHTLSVVAAFSKLSKEAAFHWPPELYTRLEYNMRIPSEVSAYVRELRLKRTEAYANVRSLEDLAKLKELYPPICYN